MTNFSDRITRRPLGYDLAAAGEVAQAFADMPAPLRDLIAAAAGCSPYLKDLARRQGDWLRGAVQAGPEAALEAVLQGLDGASHASLPADLRVAKARVALLVALADLGGVWDTGQVTRALTRLADRAVQLCVTHLVGDEIRRGKLPGAAPEDAPLGAGLFVLAMGKMGAYELNYSSDIDLICLFDQDRYGQDAPEARSAFVRVVRRMSAILQDITDQGYVFRVDLRLRPDAAVTPVACRWPPPSAITRPRAAHGSARPISRRGSARAILRRARGF